MSASGRSVSPWAPLRIGVFRALWLAVLVSNIGAWMQTVGAQWLLVHQANAAILVALVQVADMLPDVALGLVGGVLADTLDRRRLLIAIQAFLAIVGAVLTVLTIVGEMPPALLLTFTFLLGTGSVIAVPAYQSLIGDLVPRTQLRAASALGSISINLARAVGPALAGLLIARAGVAAVFALNTATFVFYGVVVAAWRPPPRRSSIVPEPFISALRAGSRYVWNAPVVRRILTRTALFLVPASALWALLPVVATQRLGQGSGGYGLLLAALGVGAIAGALLLPILNERLSMNQMVATAGVVYGAVLAAIVLVPNVWLALVLLVPAGVAWIAVLSSVNAALQLFLPGWVRGRGLSVYQMVLFGSQGAGALVWGFLAGPIGLVWTFVIAGILLIVGAATVRFWPFADTSAMDRTHSRHWREPELAPEVEPGDAPVVVSVVYTIAPDVEQRFIAAMTKVRRGRLRTGATRWGLFRDGENPKQFVEMFIVRSWDEHLRQHNERLTGADRDIEEQAKVLSDPPPVTKHLLGTEVDS